MKGLFAISLAALAGIHAAQAHIGCMKPGTQWYASKRDTEAKVDSADKASNEEVGS